MGVQGRMVAMMTTAGPPSPVTSSLTYPTALEKTTLEERPGHCLESDGESWP